ncbi:MAG: DUF2339 domain-containing protein [Candidatus Nitrohelix vancouverensis]|uniref:DUF2339 domain-containing protein n=1 Tax=Candidatus Nitrohelix vancouverensis TaxID=2705534 RepID=A0A7T0G358_9BACT|nr:MAG: DUF2339 domain-containing protein [Candidatus Nitrohelix vancouverensis]
MKEIPQAERPFIYFVLAIAFASAGLILYYACLIPPHVDEAGYWFNFTSRSFESRWAPNHQYPNHALAIYLPKFILPVLGETSLSLRLAPILFAFISWVVFWKFVHRVSGERGLAFLALALLLINPFYNQYASEMRGYTSYFLFAVLAYWILARLLDGPLQWRHWSAIFLLFLACYASTLSAPLFFSALLGALWILYAAAQWRSDSALLSAFRNRLEALPFFTFSAVATLTIGGIIFWIDRDFFFRSLQTHAEIPVNYWIIPDLFSTFLGYRYLDDPTYELARHWIGVWILFLAAFVLGCVDLLRARHPMALLFVVILAITILFFAFGGRQAPLRSAIFLFPLIVWMQACGLMKLARWFEAKVPWIGGESRGGWRTLIALTAFCFVYLHASKLSRLDIASGNPYEQAQRYLKENVANNDLVISTLPDAMGAFYFGSLIREQTRKIYENGRLDRVYYLAPEEDLKSIEMEPALTPGKKEAVASMDGFEVVARFRNSGARPSSVIIYRRTVGTPPLARLESDLLGIPDYFGNKGRVCDKQTTGKGFRLNCGDSVVVCANQIFQLPEKKNQKGQIVIFHHVNDKGMRVVSLGAVNRAKLHSGNLQLGEEFFRPVYRLNPLIANQEDLDRHRSNIPLYDLSYQRIGAGEEGLLLCLSGALFQGNSDLRGFAIFPTPF